MGLLARGDDLLAAGEFEAAAVHYQRVVGFDDPAVTAAALLGLGEARYRADDEDGAVATWEAVLELGETPSTYKAWRNLAAANVRAGVLGAAVRAYREADKRAPQEDKAEIAGRLGWLAKETGDTGAARRYFARSRGDGPLIPLSTVLIAATVIVSLVVLFTAEGASIEGRLWLDKYGLADGEYWRLWSVTLVHADPLHLFFNMYALYLAGPIVERWYGSLWFLVIYLACAAAGSTGSFAFGSDIPSVGASGAIFGLFGVLLAAGRFHRPVDRASRQLVSQLGFLIVLNLVFGFASGGQIDNAAHIGGLVAGLWLGLLMPPTRVPTMAAFWQRPASPGSTPARVGIAGNPAMAPAAPNAAPLARRAKTPPYVPVLAVGAVAAMVVLGLAYGNLQYDEIAVLGPATGPVAALLVAPPALVALRRAARSGPGRPVVDT